MSRYLRNIRNFCRNLANQEMSNSTIEGTVKKTVEKIPNLMLIAQATLIRADVGHLESVQPGGAWQEVMDHLPQKSMQI